MELLIPQQQNTSEKLKAKQYGAAALVSAIYHLMLWNRNGRHSMDDDNNGLLSDWKGGERSPIKVSLVLMAGIMVLAFVLIVQA